MKKSFASKFILAGVCIISLTMFMLLSAMVPEEPCQGCPPVEEEEPGDYIKITKYENVVTTMTTTSVGCPEGQVKTCIRFQATKKITCTTGGGSACIPTPPEGTPVDDTTCGECKTSGEQ